MVIIVIHLSIHSHVVSSAFTRVVCIYVIATFQNWVHVYVYSCGLMAYIPREVITARSWRAWFYSVILQTSVVIDVCCKGCNVDKLQNN